MPKVSIYTRVTTGGSRRRYVKATRGSTGPFYLRYELNGKRIWESLTTRIVHAVFICRFARDCRPARECFLFGEEQRPAGGDGVKIRSVLGHDFKYCRPG